MKFESIVYNRYDLLQLFILDSCQVKNGGCGTTALCSFDSAAETIKCSCKTGYSNTGTGSAVICTGTTYYSK